MSALDLLSGDAQTFLEKVWASRTHLHHTDPERLTGLLTLDDVDHLLTGTAIRTPAVRVARDGSVLPSSAFTRPATLAGQPMTGLVDPRKVFDLVDDGATVVLQGLHRYWAPLGALVADLELELGHPCQANAYLTPPGSQGFAVHSDTHDVFVFQTHGTKVWEIGRPASRTPSRRRSCSSPVSACTCRPAPRTPREPRTPPRCTSPSASTRSPGRGSWTGRWPGSATGPTTSTCPPATSTTRPGWPQGWPPAWRRCAAALRDLDAARGRGRRGAALPHRPHPGQRGGLIDWLAGREVADDTTLERRPGHPCVLVEAGERLRLLLGDRELTLPAHLRPALELVRCPARSARPTSPTTSTRRAGWCSAAGWSARGCCVSSADRCR